MVSLKRLGRRLEARLDEWRIDRDLPRRSGLAWRRMPPCRNGLYDANAVQVGSLLFIFGGYLDLGAVSNRIEILDLAREDWLPSRPLPRGVPHSHATATTDGTRYIYLAAGQVGPDCRPAVRDVFSYDTWTDSWNVLPPVPEARYAAATQLWNGRLHVVGGAAEDRWTPRTEHWSLAVHEGGATEETWREETPIPVGGMHRGSIVARGSLYVLGGQQGDFMAIPGDPDCRCTGATRETYLAACFRLDRPAGSWTRIADMPIAASHLEASTVLHDGRILVVGGQVHKDPASFRLRLTDAIQAFDIRRGTWDVLGHLPCPLKIPAVGLEGDRLTVTVGQRGRRQTDRPGPVSAATWRTILPPPEAARPLGRDPGLLAGKSVLLVSHDLSRSGAPLVLLELARALMEKGAVVRLASAADDARGWSLAAEHRVPLVPVESASDLAATADLVIANTLSKGMAGWVSDCLARTPEVAERLLWWVHEIDVEVFRPGAELLHRARVAVFDSDAARQAWAAEVPLPGHACVIHPAIEEALVRRSEADRFPLPTAPLRSVQDPLDGARDDLRRVLGVTPQDFLLCNIATVEPRKGQRELLRTVARVAQDGDRPVRLMLVGFRDAMQRAKFLLSRSAAERRVLSSARTFVRQRDLSPFYAACDAFVLNTQGIVGTRGETFGRVTTEAMLFGLPVLGTAAGGTVEIIRDGTTGFLFPPGAAGQDILAARIGDLVQDRARAREMGQAARLDALSRFRQADFLAAFEKAASHALA